MNLNAINTNTKIMRFLNFIFLVFLSSHAICQEKVDTTTFRDSSNFQIAINYYQKKIETNKSDFENYYQLACYYALKNNYDSSYNYLKNAIRKGAKGENILTDTDFNTLKNNKKEWNIIEDLLKLQYQERNPNISNLDLGYELWLMWIEDRYRTLGKNYKLKDKPNISMNEHYQRVKRLKEIIKESGWPKYSEVGIEAGDAVFYVFQHHQPKEMKKVLPIFIEAGKIGEADMGKVAMMIDRYLSFTENVQIYGSQAHKEIKKGQSFNDIKSELYPIADEENMNRRRKALGMTDFSENCNRLKVEYIPIEDRINYKKIPLKKKWIKAGYLLVE